MNKIVVSSKLQFFNEEDYLEVNGGIPVPVVVALIGAGVAAVGKIVDMDMENAVEQGRNDANMAISQKMMNQ